MSQKHSKSSSTPHSNTGSNRQEPRESGIAAHPDYLVLCGKGNIQELIEALWAVFGVNFDHAGAKPGTRGRYYSCILRSAQTIELAYLKDDRSQTDHLFRLSIPGKPLAHVRPEELSKLGRFCLARQYRCTRLDWAIDDYERTLSLDRIAAECSAGSYIGASSYRDYKSQVKGAKQCGRTIYIGSPQSDKQVRIYDKSVESSGEIDSIRYEVQWRGRLAAETFSILFQGGDRVQAYQSLSNLAVGAIGFVWRSSSVLSRCPVKEWWGAFVARVGEAVKLSVRRLQPMISEKKHWVEYQVAGTLAIISQCKGFDDTLNWLERLIRERLATMPPAGVMYCKSWFDRVKVESGEFDDWMVLQDWDRV